MRDQEEIDEQINQAMERFDMGRSKFPNMSYEEGVREALEWVTGNSDDAPMDD
jgi:hypothetical protein